MTFNPALQYFAQVVTERMTDPAAPIPEINENIKEYLRPDKEMYEKAQTEIEAFD